MLSRTASSLFWLGRYTERLELLSRYITANYYSSSDAPLGIDKTHTLKSMLNMAGVQQQYDETYTSLSDNKVIYYLTIDDKNASSIKTYVHMVRENARGVRDNISSELWEAINRFYHTINGINQQELRKAGSYEFFKNVINTTIIIKGIADNTLLHDEVRSLIRSGIHLERAFQITQMLNTKLEDYHKLEKSLPTEPLESYIWSALLRSAGGFDVSRRYYNKPLNKERALDFLLLNKRFPRSVIFSLKRLINDLEIISDFQPVKSSSAEFMTGKLCASISYSTLSEILENEKAYLDSVRENLFEIGNHLEQQYLLF